MRKQKTRQLNKKGFSALCKEVIQSSPKNNRIKLSDIEWQAHFEGIAIDLLCSMRPKTIGASHNSMIWNTASRIGQLEIVRYQKMIHWQEKLGNLLAIETKSV